MKFLTRKLCRFLCFQLASLQLSIVLLFPLSITFFIFMQFLILLYLPVFDSVLLRICPCSRILELTFRNRNTIDQVVLNNMSAKAFVSGHFNVHHKDWLDLFWQSGGTDRPDELCYNFLAISNDLTEMAKFLLRSLTVTLTVLYFWIYLFLMMAAFVLQWLSLLWEKF